MKINTTNTANNPMVTVAPSFIFISLFACIQTDTTFQPQNGKGRLTVETSIAPFPNIFETTETINSVNKASNTATIQKMKIKLDLLESVNGTKNMKLVNDELHAEIETQRNFQLRTTSVCKTSPLNFSILN